MTLIVGLKCSDGIVIASDSAATFAAGALRTIGQQSVQKVLRVNDHMLFSATGAIGMAQLIADRLGTLWKENAFSKTHTAATAMDRIGKEIGTLVSPYMQSAQIQRNLTGEAGTSLCKSLVALPVSKQPHLFQFDFNGAPEEVTAQLPFVALGSGQPIADPFLAFLRRVFWPTTAPTLAEGRLIAVWTIEHVAQTNPGGVGGPVQLATLTLASGAATVTMETPEAIEEHKQKVESAEKAMLAHVRGLTADAPTSLPTS